MSAETAIQIIDGHIVPLTPPRAFDPAYEQFLLKATGVSSEIDPRTQSGYDRKYAESFGAQHFTIENNGAEASVEDTFSEGAVTDGQETDIYGNITDDTLDNDIAYDGLAEIPYGGNTDSFLWDNAYQPAVYDVYAKNGCFDISDAETRTALDQTSIVFDDNGKIAWVDTPMSCDSPATQRSQDLIAAKQALDEQRLVAAGVKPLDIADADTRVAVAAAKETEYGLDFDHECVDPASLKAAQIEQAQLALSKGNTQAAGLSGGQASDLAFMATQKPPAISLGEFTGPNGTTLYADPSAAALLARPTIASNKDEAPSLSLRADGPPRTATRRAKLISLSGSIASLARKVCFSDVLRLY